MTLFEKIAMRILKFLGVKKLGENPNDDRYTYISSDEIVKKQKLQEFRYWYYGDSNELLNYYTNMTTYGNAEEPIYNRNKSQYFWALNSKECGIKRVHSGIPNAIITTLVNVIGDVTITNDVYQNFIDKLIEVNDLPRLFNQEQEPMTLALGYGAFKIVYDPDLSDVPLIQWYNAEDVKFIEKNGITIGIIYQDYYNYNNRDYVLMETRRTDNGNSYIEYELFRLEKNNEVTKVPLDTIPALSDLNELGYEIPGVKFPFGVKSVFFYDMLNKGYGRSIFTGKIDLFDDLDQILSQDSQTVRVSTPVEYYPKDLLERGKKGQPLMPKVYNRQYVALDVFPNGDGNQNGEIKTTQPVLNFEQYNQNAISKLSFILTGLMSPATFGIDIAKKDNADAQREKEKVTIMTRNNVIYSQQKIIKRLVSQCIMFKEYMDTGRITIQDYDISVKFNEFANPSFESLSATLTPMWTSGAISTRLFVEKLYGDSLSDEEKEQEIAQLEENKRHDDLSIGDFNNENEITKELGEETSGNEPTDEVEK